MTDHTTKSWLQRLKDESWEAELLVSIASIFAIFKAFYFLDWMVNFFIDQLNPSQYHVGYLICYLGYVAFGILGSFFVIHFGLRAYWIGIVGLNSVFPDYSIEDSAYSKTYTRRMAEKLPKLTTTVDQLDEVCSVIFSAAFTLLLIYFYFGIISSLYLLIYNLLSESVPTLYLLIPLLLIGVLYLATSVITILANLKNNKNKEGLQTWYYKIVIIGSKIFYGPLYKTLLQTTMIFGTNFKKKKNLVRAIILMGIFGFALGIFQLFQSNVTYLLHNDNPPDTTRIYPEYYRSTNETSNFLLAPEIQSFTIDSNLIHLFVPFFEHETRLIESNCHALKKGLKLTKQERWSANLQCYSEVVKIKINDKKTTVEFFKINHHKTGQFGLQATIHAENLISGKNGIKLQKIIGEDIQKDWLIIFQHQ